MKYTYFLIQEKAIFDTDFKQSNVQRPELQYSVAREIFLSGIANFLFISRFKTLSYIPNLWNSMCVNLV